ncbi:MAG: ATP-binding protein [Opitutaceae bacterium]
MNSHPPGGASAFTIRSGCSTTTTRATRSSIRTSTRPRSPSPSSRPSSPAAAKAARGSRRSTIGRASSHGFKTFVIDSVDSLERLLAVEICRKSNKDGLEDFGYGKGFTYLAEEFARFLALLDRLRERGMHLVLIGHSTIRKFEAPDAAGSYDRYELKLAKQVAALTKEWVDALLFVNYVTKLTEKDGKQKAVGGRERVIHTTHAAAFDAKNRYGLEEKLPCTIVALAPIFARSAASTLTLTPRQPLPSRPKPRRVPAPCSSSPGSRSRSSISTGAR